MTFEQLKYLIEVYQQKSFSKAAEILHISRQSLSETIKKMEGELEVDLFYRSYQGLQATDAGHEVYKYALMVMREQLELKYSLKKYVKSSANNTVSFGMSEGIISFFSERLAIELQHTFPNIHFSFDVLDLEKNHDEYRKYDISLFFIFSHRSMVYINQPDPPYKCKLLRSYPIYVWISKNSPLASRNILTYEELKTKNMLLLEKYFHISPFSQEQSTPVKIKFSLLDYLQDQDSYVLDYPIASSKGLCDELFSKTDLVVKRNYDKKLFLECAYREENQSMLPFISSVVCNS